jgi:hypothetical protein
MKYLLVTIFIICSAFLHAQPYNIYLSTTSAATAGLVFPNTSWGITSYEPDDWDFTSPIEFYVIPDIDTEFGACNITIQWNSAMFTFESLSKAGGIFDEASFQFFYSQLGSTNSVTINASRLDNENFTVVAGNFIAKLTLNILKPGYGIIDFLETDFRKFDGAGNFESISVLGHKAEVKSYLGDVSMLNDPSTGDGLVNFTDLALWSMSYWSGVTGYPGGMTNYKVKYDVGPTADNTVYSLPSTDSKIQFEDLVIFSMSYGLSGSNIYPKIRTIPDSHLEISLEESYPYENEKTISLYIDGEIANIRAMELIISGNFEELLSVEKGQLFSNINDHVLLMTRTEKDKIFIDFAIIGANINGISHNGELLLLKFKGETDINVMYADIRNVNNQPMLVKFSENKPVIPERFALFQNYPNPFNPTTTIKYQLPKQSFVELTIFNSIGEQVFELVKEFKEPGIYTAEFDPGLISSGIYFYKLKAGEFTSTKKMLFLK